MDHYQPFITDPAHVNELDRQRFVVLRMPPAVAAVYGPIQKAVRRHLSALPVSFPSFAHVTLCGFAAGTALSAVQEVAGAWARSLPSLAIEVERVTTFPQQIVVLQVRETPELLAALTSIRRMAEQHRLTVSTLVPADRWIFHMSVAYCPGLTAPDWRELTEFVDTLKVPPVTSVVGQAEVVAFDDGWEYSGGVFSLEGAEPTDTRE